jgi:heme a synthase
MGEAWIAEAALTLAPFWLNWFENGAMIQFIHRWLGLAVLVAAAVTLGAALSQDAGVRVRRAAGLCVGLVFVQFLLGIITLITVVPLSWALTHQVFACFVVLGLTYLNFLVRPRAAT